MKRLVLFIVLGMLVITGAGAADNPEAQFALFKRTISPVMKWGENGVLTIPKATTAGKLNFYTGALGQEAGTLLGKRLYLTTLSALAGTSDDFELGYSRRQLVWEDFYLTNISMDTFHLKARAFNIAEYIIPQVAVGANAVSLVDNQFTNRNDILFNIYAAATSRIPIFTPKIMLSATAVAETIMSENKLGLPNFSGGVDLALFDFLYGFAELQGFNFWKANNEVVNAGVKLRLWWLTVGAGLFNIVREKTVSESVVENIQSSNFLLDNAKWMVTLCVDVPLGNALSGGKK